MKLHKPLLLLCSIAMTPWLTAQQVYRCGNSYSHQPCDQGLSIQADDPRTAAERAQAAQQHRADQQQAQALEKSRLKREAEAQQQASQQSRQLAQQGPRPAAAAASHPATARTAKGQRRESEYFTARTPASAAGKGQAAGKH